MNERTIFLNALDLPSRELREEYVDKICSGDSELRLRVDRLLKAHEQQYGVVDRMAGIADDNTSSMVPMNQGESVEQNEDRDELSFLEPCAAPDCIGSLGSYEILEVLGRGGMGVVLKARDPKLQRIVAIKVLAPEIAANKIAKKRFEREAQAAAAVSHDHIVTIHAVDEANGLPFIVMECIVGRTLQQKIEETGPLELKEILRIGMQAAQGLAAAHKQGLVHRDIKPANILLQNGVQRVKITDFGLARSTDDVEMTRTGQIAGTPMYMSPEQAQGQRVDHLSDLFSLGSVLYTMCTGRPAFRAQSTVAILRRVSDDAPRPILDINPDLPEWLVEIVDTLMQKNKADRHQSASELADLFSEHLSLIQEPRSKKPRTTNESFNEQTISRVQRSSPDQHGVNDAPSKSNHKTLILTAAVAILAMFGLFINVIINRITEKKEMEGASRESVSTEQSKFSGLSTLPATFENSLGMEFVLVPKGIGWLGGGGGRQGQKKAEMPDDFYFGRFAVTQAQWEQVMGQNGSHFSRNGTGRLAVKEISDADLKRFPVEMVSWNEAQLFLDRLNQQEPPSGWTYRLPEEDEWEYACRGGAVSRDDSAFDFYFEVPSHKMLPGQQNFGHGETGRTCSVGSYAPNSLGLHDMHGNVHVWCSNRVSSPDSSQKDSHRVLRGGSYWSDSRFCSATTRFIHEPSYKHSNVGLRLVRGRVVPQTPKQTPPSQGRWFETAQYSVWADEVSRIPIEKQVEAVSRKLMELNPSFDGNIAPEYGNNVVTGLEFRSDNVMDISPVRALSGLRSLRCPGAWRRTVLTDLSPLKRMSLTELNIEGTRVSDLTPLKEMKLNVLRCGYTQITDLSALRDITLTELSIWHTAVTDLSPLNPAKLTTLEINGTGVIDLAALTTFKLKSISLMATKISDLTPLQGMQLDGLNCGVTPVSDLSPLAGMKLKYLSCGNTKVSSLLPLKDAELTSLICADTPVSDLSPLKGMKIYSLYCGNTQVSDLSPLEGMPFEEFHCQGAKVIDYSPMKGSSMKSLSIDFKAERDTELVRSMKSLHTVNGKPVNQFWMEVESQIKK